MEKQVISIEDLRKVKGIGPKAIERIKEQLEVSEEEANYISEYDEDIHLDLNEIHLGDCLELMNGIPDKSVDMILEDLPYGTTNIKWDIPIPFSKLWKQYDRVLKDNGAVVLFGSETFSTLLRGSNIENFKYDLVWEKEKPTNFFQLKRRFGKHTENIHIFYREQPTFNPQMRKHKGPRVTNKPKATHESITSGINSSKITRYEDSGYRYPKDVLEFNRVTLGHTIHPTQKPLDLIEYLIKTYTNEGDTVLDNVIGSGTTAIAAINTSRNFIGIEMDEEYHNIATERVEKGGKGE